ncbi:hypothetical protein [Spirulina subsalsa]|uniref:hypothetical protein n=1 Tax=Spirulina subsalsa TaxID=54311 RepID=UPI0002D88F46|nr:hypothetical protein [Spirulina subsalsa]
MTPLTLNLSQGSVSFSFSRESAQDLQGQVAELVQRLKAIASQGSSAGQRPSPQPSLDYRYTGDVFLELFCNPNIYPSPFAAKVLVTVRDDRIRLTAEAELTRLIEDVNLFLEQ